MSSFKNSENIHKKEGGPEGSFSDNQSSSVTLNELAMKDRKICLVYPGVHFLKILNASNTINDLRFNTHIINVCTMSNRFILFLVRTLYFGPVL